jgi:membrane protease subunit (stomatin/prohibitin family)
MARGLGTSGIAGGAGQTLGMAAGVGVMMPTMMSRVFSPDQQELANEPIATVPCPKCHTETPEQSRFCYRCGHPMVKQNVCPKCGEDLPTEAKFCMHCGEKLEIKPTCPHCNAEIIPGSKFCGNCGNKIDDKTDE